MPTVPVTLCLEEAAVTVAVPTGSTVAQATTAAGLALDAPCGGRGTCGKCLVRLAAGTLAPPTAHERKRLSPEDLAAGLRLGCQAKVAGPATLHLVGVLAGRVLTQGEGRQAARAPAVSRVSVQVPEPTLQEGRGDMERLLGALPQGVCPPADLNLLCSLPEAVRAQGGQVSALLADGMLAGVDPGWEHRCLGLAVDIGTTTVVAYLLDLDTGQQVGMASGMNEQAAFGGDVISRIEYASRGGARALQDCIVSVINRLAGEACKQAEVEPEAICEVTVVGNTCMHHLFLGLPTANLAAMPFTAAATSALRLRARDVGLRTHPGCPLYALPNVAGFVGADAVGVMLASGLAHGDGLRVAIDIGTNGEVMAARGERVVACSTAAGPAFEGAKISRGMRAAPGAIDRVRLEGKPAVHIIGGPPARGLCGSGLIDALAELTRLGIVEENGHMLSKEALPAGIPEAIARRVVSEGGQPAFLLARGEAGPVLLTSRDVREAQLAKAALAAGLAILLDELQAGPADIEQFMLAGAFGNYIDRESAVTLGLVPDLPPERIRPVGNAAGMGARLALLSVPMRREAEAVARRAEHIELSAHPDFYERFAEAMLLRPVPA